MVRPSAVCGAELVPHVAQIGGARAAGRVPSAQDVWVPRDTRGPGTRGFCGFARPRPPRPPPAMVKPVALDRTTRHRRGGAELPSPAGGDTAKASRHLFLSPRPVSTIGSSTAGGVSRPMAAPSPLSSPPPPQATPPLPNRPPTPTRPPHPPHP